MELHLTATGCHLPYGITQCYLPPDTSEHTPPSPSQTGWYSIYRPFKGGGLTKPRPRVQRATGPLLLRDSPELVRTEPTALRLLVQQHVHAVHYRVDTALYLGIHFHHNLEEVPAEDMTETCLLYGGIFSDL